MDNNKERREVLKQIIRDIHAEKDPEELKARFSDLISDIGATEIAQLEQELIEEGLPETEVKSLCDVHVAVFQEGLEKQLKPEEQGGHPVNTFQKENNEVGQLIKEIYSVIDKINRSDINSAQESIKKWKELHQKLLQIEKHYSRKENILFAYLEKHGVSGPPKVMWAIQDEIRDQLKELSDALENESTDLGNIEKVIDETAKPVLKSIEDLIYKEENILFPMSLETLSEGEWVAIAEQSDEIGYTLVEPGKGWQPESGPEPILPHQSMEGAYERPSEGLLPFETGALTIEQLELIFSHMPVDITFVDADDAVRYFSNAPERIFQRSVAIIGRKVQNCHPPDSVHIVNQIVSDFKNGRRDSADFWLELGGKFVYIQYFAVRDKSGHYRGTLEVSQDVSKIRQLQGEKRIYDEGQ